MIIGPVVIDASVAVEYLVDLTFTEQSSRLFAGLVAAGTNLEIWAPDLLFTEVASALRKLTRLKALTASGGDQAIENLVRLPIGITGTAALIHDAWALRGALTIYDATYVALAQRMDVPLVSADRRLLRACAARGQRAIFLGDL